MPEEVQAVEEEVKPPEPVKPPVKLRKSIQPTDKEGRPIGQPHVYYYTDEADLGRQLSETVVNGSRRIYELKLGTPVKFEVPEGAEIQEQDTEEEIPEFKPRILTADEQFSLANKLRDPATTNEAFDELYEARTGAKPEVIARVLSQVAKNTAAAKRDAAKVRARTEALAFAESHPEFVPNQANSNAMITYLNSHKDEKGRSMALTVKNFEIAFKALNDEGLLIVQPEPEPVVVPDVPPAPPRTEEPVATRTRGTADLPSTIGRTDNQPSSPVKSGKPSAAAIAMMTADQYLKAVQKWPDLHKR